MDLGAVVSTGYEEFLESALVSCLIGPLVHGLITARKYADSYWNSKLTRGPGRVGIVRC